MNFQVKDASGNILLSTLVPAFTWFARFRGLLGKVSVPEDWGLWIKPCRSIHCIAMKFSIDAIFIDNELRVVKTFSELKPWRFAAGGRIAESVIETRAGFVRKSGIKQDDILKIEEKR